MCVNHPKGNQFTKLDSNLSFCQDTYKEEQKKEQPDMCIDPRISFDSLSFALLSDINICLGCGPLLSGTAAVIGLIDWSKQRHICGESLRLEVNQR